MTNMALVALSTSQDQKHDISCRLGDKGDITVPYVSQYIAREGNVVTHC